MTAIGQRKERTKGLTFKDENRHPRGNPCKTVLIPKDGKNWAIRVKSRAGQQKAPQAHKRVTKRTGEKERRKSRGGK